jgi:hypothetical protein
LVREGRLCIDEIEKRKQLKRIAEQQGIEKDYLSTFDDLIDMLSDSGFKEVECFWRYFDDVMIIACKQKSEAIVKEQEWLELASETEAEEER